MSDNLLKELQNGWILYLGFLERGKAFTKRADPAVPSKKLVVDADDEPE
jgi:hypothetical protein